MSDAGHLISCDWGTSRFRLRLLRGGDAPVVVAERSTARGIAGFTRRNPEDFESCLAREIDRLFRRARLSPVAAPICLSGMITSSLGWRELEYAPLPFPLDGSRAVIERTTIERPYGSHEAVFLSGVRSGDDAMRGEETELIGLLSAPGLERLGASCLAILPGTHCKAVTVEGGSVTAFRTYMTGELYRLLREGSILRHSLGPETDLRDEGRESFETGVRRGAADGILGTLFTVRTNDLLRGLPPGLNTAYLSGLLIGDEVASILRTLAGSRDILLGGSPELQASYRAALEVLGAAHRVHAVPGSLASTAAALGHWKLRTLLGS